MTLRSSVAMLELGGSEDGHRGAYARLFEQEFGAVRLPNVRAARAWRGALLIPMIEGGFATYVGLCIYRAVLGRRTAGLLFRPRPALDGTSFRLRAKRAILKTLRRVRWIDTLTILPFAIEPAMAGIADGWIYDPQLWDFQSEEGDREQADPAVLAALRDAAAGRQVCVAVGRQDRAKGFDRFARMWSVNSAVRRDWLFAFGGRVEPALEPLSAEFSAQGGLALNRFVSDTELLALYAAADLVWCTYAEDYDQASGILGRAMQFGLPVTVRPGSLVEQLCHGEGHPAISLDGMPDDGLPDQLPPKLDRTVASQRAARQRAVSLVRLKTAFGWPTEGL